MLATTNVVSEHLHGSFRKVVVFEKSQCEPRIKLGHVEFRPRTQSVSPRSRFSERKHQE